MKKSQDNKAVISSNNNRRKLTSSPQKADKKELAKRKKQQDREGLYLPSMEEKLLPDINVIGDNTDGEIISVKSGVDRILLVIVAILVCFGSVMVFSASYADAAARYDDSYYFIKRQIVFVGIGLVAMIIVMNVPYKLFKFWAVPSYILTLGLLVVVLAMGLVRGGAQRWISIGGFTFQPSELGKLTLVLMLAWYYTTFQEGMRYKKWSMISKNPDKRKGEKKLWWRANFTYGLFFPGCIIALIVLLVALEKHLSGIIILGLIGLTVMFVSGCNGALLGGIMGIAGSGVVAFALLTDYTKRRIDIWLAPEQYPLDGGWQTLQGMNAIGSGGLWGLGLGGSRQKYSYVSQPQNDFIFTIVCEELGFVGAVAVMLLFGLLVWRGFVIAKNAPDSFSGIVAAGISSKVAIQVLLNIGVVTNSLPNTGISLPFFSYGGSSLIMLFVEMGILLSISRYSYIRK